MKRIFYLIFASLLTLAACHKSGPQQELLPEGKVSLTVHVGDPSTKVIAASKNDENKVSSVQVVVFDSAGITEAYAKGGTTLTVGVVAGAKTVWAIANCSMDLSTVQNEAELSAKAVDLGLNDYNSLVMAGKKSATISSTAKSVNVDVSHLVCKVVLDKITRNFTVAALASKQLTINSAYLIDVMGDVSLAGSPLGKVWYNKMSHADASLDKILFSSKGAALANGGEMAMNMSFYPYPNNTAQDSSSSTWSARKTKLVLDTTFDGKKQYYTIPLMTLERNKIYEFTNITLTKRGSDDPEKPVTSEDVSVTVKVTDFISGATYTETI